MTPHIRLRSTIRLLLSVCFLATFIEFAAGNDPKPAAQPLIKTTHVYKTVGDLKVEADVYRPEGAEARPVVVWIYGGSAQRRVHRGGLAGAQADSGAVFLRAIYVGVAR